MFVRIFCLEASCATKQLYAKFTYRTEMRTKSLHKAELTNFIHLDYFKGRLFF